MSITVMYTSISIFLNVLDIVFVPQVVHIMHKVKLIIFKSSLVVLFIIISLNWINRPTIKPHADIHTCIDIV